MKKIFALLALVLGVVSCQTEPEGLDVNVGGEQEVMLTVSLPETTRANSANGFNLDSLATTDYSLRYILEVYLGENCQRHVLVSDNTSVAFPVRLAPDRDYKLVVWADIVVGDSQADRYYNTDPENGGLKAVSIVDSTWNAMDETRDAFTATQAVSAQDIASGAIQMHLKRPFAKLRVVATDYDDVADLGLKPAKATVVYSQDMPRIYNALTGAASDAALKSHTTITYPADTDDAVYSYENGEYTLFADYFFVPASGTAKFQFNVYAEGNNLIKATNFNTDIYVAANKLTTIKGDVLTTGANIKVDVEENGKFDEEKTITVVENAQHLQQVIDAIEDGNSETIVLGGDINLGDLFGVGILSTRATEPAYGLIIPKDKTVVLDLKGYTISQTKTQTTAYSMIDNRGTLIIKDSSEAKTGKLNYTDDGQGGEYVSNTLHNSGVLTIEGGIVENSSSATVAANGYPHPIDNSGTLTINGGTFINNADYSSMRIWCTTDDDTIVTIKGGTFNGSIDFQTPDAAANKGTLTITGGTFNADTYTKCAVRLLGFGADVDEMNGYISGGQFNGAITLSNRSGSELNSKVFNITGGTFTVDPSEFVDDDYNVKIENGKFTIELKNDAVEVNNTPYKSLKKAFEAVQNGQTVKFINDVVQADGVIITDKNITIDLNGKTFTVTNGANTNNRNFKVDGSSVVTIKNGTMVAAGEYSSGAYGTLRTEGTANVTLNGVKLYNYRGNGLNVKALKGTTVTINDSEIYSQYGGGVEAAGGTIELTKVKIEQKGMYTAPYNSMAISVNGEGTATVNSGTYSTECITAEEANNQGTSHGPWCAGVLNSGGTLIIKGGTFSNDNFGDNALATAARGLLLADTGANIQIEGGTFNAVKKIIDIQNNLGDASKNPTATISGGDFSSNPLTWDGLISVAKGYVVEQTTDSRYSVVKDVKVAKVGTTEYRDIDEAIANWTNNTTLTLMSDVTLNDVITLKSTEHHILDLGTYTMTAAEGKNAFEIKACGTGDAERTAITINADATNPGSINAGNKCIVYYKYADGGISGNDRPIINIKGGILNAPPSSWATPGIYFIGGDLARQAATLQIEGGEFYCSINGSGKSKLIIKGGLFHHSVGSQGDSTALRLISGGTFKSLGFMTADDNNTKFWIGTEMAKSDVGLYINDDNYLVVGGPVITEFGDKFTAKATNATKWSSYLKYSSAAANGLYYTNAEMAIKKHGEANVVLK